MTDLRMYEELGAMAALAGSSRDSYAYKKPERVNAWLRGFNQYHTDKATHDAQQAMTKNNIEAGKAHIAHLREMLGEEA